MRGASGAVVAAAVVSALAASCGGGAATFGLTADDNNPARLAQALSRRRPPPPGPRNASGAPLVVAVTASPRRLVAYDLATGAARWSVDADVRSRVAIAGEIVVAREAGGAGGPGSRDALVARALSSGQVRWRHAIEGGFVGAAADRERAYLVTGDRGRWTLVALDAARGEPVWSVDAPGALGAPVAADGLVLVPFLSQWLSVLDAGTGEALTRIRGVDAQISIAGAIGGELYFGSRAGVFRLDAQAAHARRDRASHARIALPAALARASYGAEAYDAAQAAYGAAERSRILWRPAPGPGLRFAGDGGVVHWFRFVFGVSTDGALRWAYTHPRVDLVASAHLGGAVAAVSSRGEVVALDPVSGAVRGRVALALGGGTIAGATFDADGWMPTRGAEPAPSLASSLAVIARDRDQRWAAIQAFAVESLGALPGVEVARVLVELVQDERTAAALRDIAAARLAARIDPAALPVLTEAIAVRFDLVDGTAPRALAAVAGGVAALAGAAIDPEARSAAIAALLGQLRSPAISTRELAAVVAALTAIGEGVERAPLREVLLLHRADPAVAGDSALVQAVIDGLVAGGPADREVVRLVAEDGRSHAAVAGHARRALAGAPTR